MQHSEYSHTAAVQKIDLWQDTCENLAPIVLAIFVSISHCVLNVSFLQL